MINCGCILVDVDGGNCSTVSDKVERTARKPHKCCECGAVISPGDRYESYRGLWEGGWATYKTCINCLSIRDEFFCSGFEFEALYDHLLDHITNVDGVISSGCMKKLTKNARDKICDMIEEYWEDWE